jgi:hypothetical protein
VPFFLLFLWFGLRVHLTTVPEEESVVCWLSAPVVELIDCLVDAAEHHRRTVNSPCDGGARCLLLIS